MRCPSTSDPISREYEHRQSRWTSRGLIQSIIYICVMSMCVYQKGYWLQKKKQLKMVQKNVSIIFNWHSRGEEDSTVKKWLKLMWSWFLLALSISPVIAAFFVYKSAPGSVALTSYVFYKPGTNYTKILQATTLNDFERVIFGTSKDLLHQVRKLQYLIKFEWC